MLVALCIGFTILGALLGSAATLMMAIRDFERMLGGDRWNSKP